MSVVGACYMVHRKILESLKAEGKITTDKNIRNTQLRELIKLYGLERFKNEVKEKNLDVPAFLLEDS